MGPCDRISRARPWGSKVVKSPAIAEDAGCRVTSGMKPAERIKQAQRPFESASRPFDKLLSISYNRGVTGMDSRAFCFSGHHAQPTLWAAPSIERIRPRHIRDRMANSIGGFVMVKEIPLTQGKVALVDDADHEWLNQWKWCASNNGLGFYAVRGISRNDKRTTIAMHQMILNAPPGLEPDHINGDGLDNRRCNLRLCTRSQNNMNARKQTGCSSRWKGVYWDKAMGKWRALIRIHGIKHYLGYFTDEDEAAQELFGEFARLNAV